MARLPSKKRRKARNKRRGLKVHRRRNKYRPPKDGSK